MLKMRQYIKFKQVALLLLLCLHITSQVCAAGNKFMEERYRGWMWFEESEQEEEVREDKRRDDVITPYVVEEAKKYNAKFKKELEDLRAVMIRHPENLNYVLAYKRKEAELLRRSEHLGRSWLLANLLDPDLLDELNNPKNMYGRKARKSLARKEQEEKLKMLATKIELFIFRQDNCEHCHFLERHLNHMAKTHNFEVTAITQDGSKSPYFPAHRAPELIKALNLKAMPMVVAVTKDSSERFEIARGAVSIPEMEEKLLLVDVVLKNKAGNGAVHGGQEKVNGSYKLPKIPVVAKPKTKRETRSF